MNKIETLSCLELPRVSLLLSGAEWCRQFAATIDHRRSFITRLGWATPHWASIGRAGESGAWLAAASARHHLGTSGARTVTAQCQQGEAGPRAAKALFSWVSDNDGSLGSSSQQPSTKQSARYELFPLLRCARPQLCQQPQERQSKGLLEFTEYVYVSGGFTQANSLYNRYCRTFAMGLKCGERKSHQSGKSGVAADFICLSTIMWTTITAN